MTESRNEPSSVKMRYMCGLINEERTSIVALRDDVTMVRRRYASDSGTAAFARANELIERLASNLIPPSRRLHAHRINSYSRKSW